MLTREKAFSGTVLESILQTRKFHESEEQEHAKRKEECVLRLWAIQVSRAVCEVKVINSWRRWQRFLMN